jgi:hypothetical protein
MHSTRNTTLRHVALFGLALAGLSGCGDAGMFSRGELRSFADAKLGAELQESDVLVEYESSRCHGDGAEPCVSKGAPAVEAHVDSRSIFLDFANVEAPGRFPEGELEGFVVEVHAGDKPILFAEVDRAETNLQLGEDAVQYGDDYVEINLAGVDYDTDGFIKIDLLVGPLKILGRGP